MTYNIKYKLFLDNESIDKEINIKNRKNEYDACNSLYSYLLNKYPNYKKHEILKCDIISDSSDDSTVNYLRNIFGI